MGQKTHPYSFRLGVATDWKSKWFSTKDYVEFVNEDWQIREWLRDELIRGAVSRIDIERTRDRLIVDIHTARPGIVIGRKGAAVKDMRQKLKDLTGKTVRVEVEEITQPDANAQLIAENITGQLERRISHSRAMKRAVLQAMRAGVKGIRIEASGRLSGSEMARNEKLWEGRVPRNMIRADLDYGFAEALTTYGRIGVKVWVYKGEILPQRVEATDVYISE